MTTLLITHPSSLNHLVASGHPERPDRIRAVNKVLAEDRFKPLVRAEAPVAPLEAIALCHPMDYVTDLRDASPKEGLVPIDADTTMSPGSFAAATRAVGGALQDVDAVIGKEHDNAFVAMRAPGQPT